MTDKVSQANLMIASNEVALIGDDAIKSRILTIRGVQVLLDRDLAMLYGVETKVLNQAVKRNIVRFPDGFMFQLSRDEMENWKSLTTITLVHGEDDDVNLGGCDVYVVGEHLDGATAVEYCATEDGEAFYTMDAAYDPETGRLSGHADFVGSSPQRGFARVTTPGGTATHAVEFSNH